jgi:hypothetical protein
LILNGTTVTASAAELNIMNGITASTVELNYTNGVTSAIQTQLNTKAPLASPTFTGTVTAPTLNSSSLNLSSTGGLTAISTQAQAEAGTVNTVVMTPLRVAQAISAQVPAPTAAQVGAATADLGAGSVGTYAFLYKAATGSQSLGSTLAGSGLRTSGVKDDQATSSVSTRVEDSEGSTRSGTWKCMGHVSDPGPSDREYRTVTLWLRIS